MICSIRGCSELSRSWTGCCSRRGDLSGKVQLSKCGEPGHGLQFRCCGHSIEWDSGNTNRIAKFFILEPAVSTFKEPDLVTENYANRKTSPPTPLPQSVKYA